MAVDRGEEERKGDWRTLLLGNRGGKEIRKKRGKKNGGRGSRGARRLLGPIEPGTQEVRSMYPRVEPLQCYLLSMSTIFQKIYAMSYWIVFACLWTKETAMASDSPRARIDQFFSSKKKRKIVSPASKSSGRLEKEAKKQTEGSPSAKASLEIYLETSKDSNSPVKSLNSFCDQKTGQVPIKRNLTLETGLSSRDENGDSCQGQRQSPEASGVAQILRPELLSDTGSVAAKGIQKDSSITGAVAVNSELKEFATGFLSLYCSASLPSETKETTDKRHSSSSVQLQEKSSKERHCGNDGNQSNVLNESSSSPKGIQSKIVNESRDSDLNCLQKVIMCNNPFESQAGLRKCSYTSTICKAECETPGSFTTRPGARETPQSTRGSSLFSPGEAFWNEAIVVADGLLGPSDGFSSHVAENREVVKVDYGTHCSHNVKNGGRVNLLNRSPDGVTDTLCDVGTGSAVGLPGVHGKNLEKEVSPLPVKHFDFSLEANFFDKGTSGDANNNIKPGILTIKQNTFVSTDHNPQSFNHMQMCPKDQTDEVPSMLRNSLSIKVAVNHESKSNCTPASSSRKDCLDLTNWLPLEICNIYNKKGISKLYPWQVDCLQVEGVLHTRNLVYCASTRVIDVFEKYEKQYSDTSQFRVGSGARSVGQGFSGGKIALLVLPYVSICARKEHLEVLLEPVGKHVRSFYGNQGGGTLPEDTSGNVDSSSGESSGTSSGRSILLVAALYETDFRPVPLEEYIKVGSTIYNKEMEIVRTIPKVADLGGKDPDHVVELCNEVVQEGHSVLIFCSSRKGCESTARHIAKYLKRFSVSPRSEQGDSFDVSFAIDSLRRSPAGLDPILEETLPLGVAYHHAGLTVEERETVETCYRKGLVRVLTATSTLAAGVNLPARRVIFRQPRIGRDFIDGTRYKQMAGRAGRTGIDTKGESVIICKPEETKKILALLNDSCPPLNSCLSEDRNGMTHAILEVVAGGIVQTASDIHRYVRCTLLNSMKPFEDVVKSAQDSLRWLCHKKFLEWSEATKLYTTTPLGRASFGSSLCPEESLVNISLFLPFIYTLHHDRAREGFVLASELHLVYLVTPINVDVEPDWELYYERYMQLSSLDQSVGNRVGVQEPFLMRMAHGAPPRALHRSRDNAKGFQGKYDHRHGMSTNGMLSDDQMLRVCKRFYVALILSRLVQEVPVGEVCEGFKVARGMVQALQENAGRFASMVSVFCERLGWHDLEGLVAKFQNRVSFGVRAEIVELTAIPFIKASRARALYKAGLRTPQAIAEASIPEIVKALFESSSWNAHEAQRKMQVGVAKKIKNGARKIVLEKAEEARVAAFSAFKSLGLDIAQFSHPLLPIATGNALQKESRSSSGEETTSSYILLQHSKHTLDPPLFGDRHETAGVISDVEPPAVDFESLVKEKSAGGAQGETSDEKPVLHEECSNTLNYKLNLTNNYISHTNGSTSHPLTDVGNTRSQSNLHFDHVRQQQPENENVCMGSKENTLEKSPVNAVSIPGGLDSFLDLSQGKDQSMDSKEVLLPKLLLEMAEKRWTRIGIIMGRKDVKKFTWNLKVQIQVLKSPAVSVHKFSNLHGGIKSLGLDLIDNSYFMFSPVHVRIAIDMCVVAWILSPDEERSSYPNLEKEVKRRLSSDAAASANRTGRWKDQMRRAAHNGCCRRVAQTRALFSVLWKLLESEELVEPLMTVEIQLANILADMEIWGIGVDMEGCLKARHILGRKLRCLEKEAYRLAGRKFSLSMPADIANILYEHLKLPMPEGIRGKQHPSTDKHCLDVLRNEHPIVPVIKEHRALAKLLNSTLGSICSLARLSMRAQKYTLHGHWLQTSTATGRLSMEEPNLQCVEHMVEFKINEDDGESGDSHYKINARDFFVPTQDDWLLLTADYSQIELRLMAHFSKDDSLIKLLTSPQADVFTMIAAKWSEKHESSVSSQERDQTKRLVYGILYGMGPNTLAEQLDCSPDEAAERIRNFKKSFPGVASWLQEAVKSCHRKGYVETYKGRKRFLAKIKFGNSKEKSKAQRQAVNSICQGSAADIIKIAMICLHNVIGEDTEASCPAFIDAENFQKLKGRCRVLLQVHDELVLEADPLVVNEAGLLLRTCMENSVSLLDIQFRLQWEVGTRKITPTTVAKFGVLAFLWLVIRIYQVCSICHGEKSGFIDILPSFYFAHLTCLVWFLAVVFFGSVAGENMAFAMCGFNPKLLAKLQASCWMTRERDRQSSMVRKWCIFLFPMG
ncbi:hypothetical protein DH2020_001672 [Rehmannia glutinosa]|uniref:Helicase C-terminal domain-containing protein n=1 Tax=Rehmannia glutinosa TaxID=99300 RepID=A0ABR0XRP8_REHGL